MKRTEAPGSVAGMYVDENPEGEVQGTLLVAADRNALQEELIHLIQTAGLTPSDGDLTQIRQAVQIVAQALAAAAAAAATAAHAALQAEGVHGSTSEATAGKAVHRDGAGRAKFAAPSASADAAIKSTVDAAQAAVQALLDAHAALQAAGVHGSTVAATPGKIMVRDAAGRAQVAAPSAAADIARKDTVDDHAALQAAGVHGSTSAATPGKVMHRDGAGRVQVADPAAAADCSNKKYVDEKVIENIAPNSVGNTELTKNHTSGGSYTVNPESYQLLPAGWLIIVPTQGNPTMSVYINGSWRKSNIAWGGGLIMSSGSQIRLHNDSSVSVLTFWWTRVE